MCRKVDAFEMSYRRMLKISYKDRVTNNEVLHKVREDLHFVTYIKKKKLMFGGHLMIGSSGEAHDASIYTRG